MSNAILNNQVPPNWKEVAYESVKPLASWFEDLKMRFEFMRNWIVNGHPSCFWLSGFFFPHGFITGTLQVFARKHKAPIDQIQFEFIVQKQMTSDEVEDAPEDGIYVNGLFIEGAKWSFEHAILEDQSYGEMHSQMPVIHFLPRENFEANPEDF